jgi:hypothetical protein
VAKHAKIKTTLFAIISFLEIDFFAVSCENGFQKNSRWRPICNFSSKIDRMVKFIIAASASFEKIEK